MNWEETLNVIEPLVSERGYLIAKAFLLSRRTYEEGIWIFKRIEETKFIIETTLTGDGIVLKPKHNDFDFIIIY